MAHCGQFDFRPISGYWFTSYLVGSIRDREGCFETTLDIGLSRREICVSDGIVKIDDQEFLIDDIEPSEVDRVVILERQSLMAYEVAVHIEDGYYKLKAVDIDKAPTLEINGIHMHRVRGIDPWRDTLQKIRAARVKRGNRVLDTCMGLGYTSIASIARGAVEVYTFEIDENVFWIAMRNPWSSTLGSSKIRIFHGDVTKCIYDIPDGYFDRVIHDPPRFTRQTGDLYGLEFYKELYRVLKPGGILFHYTGEPHRHSGISVLKGIRTRLVKAGFKVLGFSKEAQGYVAMKLI